MNTALDRDELLAPPGAGAAAGAPAASFKDHVETVLASVFGMIFLGLALVVTVETLSRKLFNVSLQGADELGGYALAVGSTLAFSLALMGRAHIRVDVFHELLPRRVQAFMNWFAALSLAAFGVFIAWVAFKVIGDTLQYRSTAQTPWATPLIIPQSVWYAGLVIFALVAGGYALRATGLLFAGRIATLNTDFHPRSAKEELKEELDDLAQRQAAEGGQP
ncbi:MAG TPA: TRAP transporter small permease [Ramlibacter sp.]|uniref:TRAP transporter small permease subunit n=1 Tax=Ramlibacter sp. TaxID=1917967 RepID=UPI002D7EADC9|nr:TRAP transporter small permease [Ramlibacter sp.]HET8747097.1 TRAP transporter small permease [Ramlibacter sp.]